MRRRDFLLSLVVVPLVPDNLTHDAMAMYNGTIGTYRGETKFYTSDKSYLFNLVSTNKISDTTLLDDLT